MVEQVVKDGIVMQGVAVAVEAGVDVVFLAGGEPVAYEFVLQGLAGRGRSATRDRPLRHRILRNGRCLCRCNGGVRGLWRGRVFRD